MFPYFYFIQDIYVTNVKKDSDAIYIFNKDWLLKHTIKNKAFISFIDEKYKIEQKVENLILKRPYDILINNKKIIIANTHDDSILFVENNF